MTRAQAEAVVIGLLEPLVAFARKRCATPQDAEDLTQEIAIKLLRTLPGREDIGNAEGYCWTVAHNALANYYRGKARRGYGALPSDLPGGVDPHARLEDDESHAHVRAQIARLSDIARRVVVLFYCENMKQQAIADHLGVSLAMVKWHLSKAKTDIKRSLTTMTTPAQLSFNPIAFCRIGCNGTAGSMGHNGRFLRSALAQNILYAVCWEPLSANDIANALGVSPVYVRSEAEYLAEYGFLIRQGKGYLSNCIIEQPTRELNQLLSQTYSHAAQLLAPQLCDALAGMPLQKMGVLLPGGDVNFALWALVPYVLAHCDQDARPDDISFEEAATRRPDGGENICLCVVDAPGVEPPMYEYSMGRMGGPAWAGDEDCTLWLVDTEWSGDRVGDYGPAMDRDAALLKRFAADEALFPDEMAYMVSRGYLKPETLPAGERTSPRIVWIMGDEAKRRLLAVGDAIRQEHRAALEQLKAPYVQARMATTPPHLHKALGFGMQHMFYCDGWLILHCLHHLLDAGKLQVPTDAQRQSLTAVMVTR